ncbi:hypothetical protein ES703_112496 [subsurface metagenome]
MILKPLQYKRQEQKVDVVIEGEFSVVGGLEESITFALKSYGWTKEKDTRFHEMA